MSEGSDFESLQVKPVDERDHVWEVSDPEYRVFFFDLSSGLASEGVSYRTDTYGVAGGSFEQVRSWADKESRGRAIGIGVLVLRDSEPGLIWVYGKDLNANTSDLGR